MYVVKVEKSDENNDCKCVLVFLMSNNYELFAAFLSVSLSVSVCLSLYNH